MKDYSGYSAPLSLSISRFTSSSDKAGSDSGVSSRGSSSGSSDERSGSRSSALSGLDENLPSAHQQQQQQPPQQYHQPQPYLHPAAGPHHYQQHRGPSPSSRDKSSPTAIGVSGGHSVIAAAAAADRYYLHHPAHAAPPSGHHQPPTAVFPLDAVRVWRDHPSLSLSLIGDSTIRHVGSVQHQPLLMSHPAVGVGSSPSSSASVAAVSPSSVATAPSTPSAHYPPSSAVPSMITPPPLQHQLPPHLYAQMPEMLWKPPRFPGGLTAAHLHSAAIQDELLERERAYVHDRDRQERQDRHLREQEREVEKQKEREKQREREKLEKDRLEKQRAEQAVIEHFSKTQTLGYKKSSGWNFLPTSSAPNSNSFRINDDERKRMIEQEQQRMIRSDLREREKMTGLPAFTPYAHNLQMPKSTTATPVPSNSASTPSSTGGSTAAVIQNRVKSQMSLPKSESMYNVYGYPTFSSPLNLYSEKMMKNSVAINSIVPNKSSSAMDRELLMSGAHPHGVQPVDMKNSVIVKNDGKSHSQMPPSHMLPTSDVVLKSGGGSLVAGTAATAVIPSHSPNLKVRVSEAAQHYLQPPPPSAGKPYEYRSPSQSPLQAAHITNATSPHQLHVDPIKMHHRASSSPASVPPSSHHRQSPLPLTQSRQSPQTHHRQSPQTHHRQSPLPANQPPVQLAPHQRHSPHLSSTSSRTSSPPEQRYISVASPNTAGLYTKGPIASLPHPAAAGVNSAAYAYSSSMSSVTSVPTSMKPKVSSPAPPHFYGKPTSGISTGTPVCRPQEVSINAVPINSKVLITPSPYQQLSQHQPPPSTIVSTHQNLDPPPAHSSHLTSVVNDPHSFFSGASSTGGPGAQRHSVAADLTASGNAVIAAGATVVASSSETTVTIVSPTVTAALPSQMQPLDLGVKESTTTSLVVPAELTKRKLGEDDELSDQPATKRVHADVLPEVSVVPPTPTASTAPTTDEATEQNPQVATITSAAPPAPVEPPPPSLTPAPLEESSVAPPVTCSSPSTPAKLAPSSIDGEKSNSPKPPSYSGHKLKKAWLQRHSGEDVGDEKIGSTAAVSSAVKSLDGSLSINENDGNVPTNGGSSNADRAANGSPLSSATVTKDVDNATSNALTSLNNSLNSIGSMAVNSISKVKQPKGGAGKKSAKDNRASPLVPNGHLSPKVSGNNSDESSSTDTDTKASPKRVPPKLKRKKHGTPRKTSAAAAAAAGAADTTPKRKKLNSTSSTDSDKESASEKDSEDNSTGKKMASGNGGDDKKDNSRKRGRKPKTSSEGYASGNGGAGGAAGGASSNGNGGQKDDDAPKEKKMRDEPRDQKDPFPKPPVSQLKKTGESFLQDGPCFEVAPKLAKCRECRWTQNQRSKSNSNIFCRFYAFRRLRYTKNGQLAIAGFSDPYRDAKHDDLNLWLPNTKNPPTDLDLEVARFTLLQVGDQFCDLLMQEADAINLNLTEDKKIAWKRVVQGVREMCDVCETTLFNFHWACSKCGFVVCIDCYKGRKNGTVKIWGESGKDRDDLSWLLCTNRQAHEQEKLMLTQIIAGDALMKLLKSSHDTRAMWDMALNCGCPLAANPKPTNDICKMIMRNLKQEKIKKAEQVNGQVKTENGTEESAKDETDSPLNWLADVALNQNKSSADDDGDSSDDSEEGSFSTLRELLIRPASKTNGNNSQPSSPSSSAQTAATSTAASTSTTVTTSSTSSSTNLTSTSAAAAVNKAKPKKSVLEHFNEMLSSVGGECHDDNGDDFIDDRFANNGDGVALKYFVRDHMRKQYRSQGHCPIRIMTLSESKLLYPDVPHSWLCDGKLLRLLDAIHPGNYTIFQDQWRRGQPVIVSDVSKRLSPDLWHPDSFIRDFGDVKNDLINCMTGKVVPNQPMRKFWEGFEFLSRRLKDDKGNDMLLKLKDWPPGEDFAEMLPSRYNDLMSVLPLGEYTQRNGRLNLASRLPECFVRPDLGPKMYNAYGSAMHPNKGTTNLHLDISDAVNVMVYVGIPKDGDNEEHIKEAYRAIDEAGCDILTRRRVREKGELPGALWHIYAARDADKIRDLLNKVAIERGDRLEPNHDPIHDQSCYLDGPLRERLFKEYAVEGYAIVQCMGDAVFVPAGAPHQVRNLHNCVKVAEDFVSPENVSHCFHLTQEFRYLSDTHSNHEDKLQIKNIMYHAVKDSLSVMGAALSKSSQKAKENSGGDGATGSADAKPAVKAEPKSES